MRNDKHINIVRKTRQQKEGKVYTLGDLIHNPQVVADLKSKGVEPIKNLDKLHEGTIIIRSHGISPEIYSLLAKREINIVDATCPIVKKIQELVEGLAEGEEEIILVGNKKHPEIRRISPIGLTIIIYLLACQDTPMLGQ